MSEVAQAADKATSKTAVLSLNKASDTPSLRGDALRGLDILRFTRLPAFGFAWLGKDPEIRTTLRWGVGRNGTACDEHNQVR